MSAGFLDASVDKFVLRVKKRFMYSRNRVRVKAGTPSRSIGPSRLPRTRSVHMLRFQY
jgi:hypothetical protein